LAGGVEFYAGGRVCGVFDDADGAFVVALGDFYCLADEVAVAALGGGHAGGYVGAAGAEGGAASG